jgi:hypothetical protein
MNNLECWFNPQATRAVEDYNHREKLTLDRLNLALLSTEFIKDSTTYVEALNHELKEDQIKWKLSINKELNEMTKRGGWEVIMTKYFQIIDNALHIIDRNYSYQPQLYENILFFLFPSLFLQSKLFRISNGQILIAQLILVQFDKIYAKKRILIIHLSIYLLAENYSKHHLVRKILMEHSYQKRVN